LPSRKARDVKRALLAKGFREDPSHHWYYRFYHEGKKSPIYTKISHSATDLSKMLCGAMARQMKLTSPQFEEFVECTITAEKYTTILISGKYLPLEENQKKVKR
jgi:hypothetical protein